MKKFAFIIILLLIKATTFAQFSDTSQLITYVRDTIKDRRPDKVTAAQLQKAILGITQFLKPGSPADSTQYVKKAGIDTITGNKLFIGKQTFEGGDTNEVLINTLVKLPYLNNPDNDRFLTTDGDGYMHLANLPGVQINGNPNSFVMLNQASGLDGNAPLIYDVNYQRFGAGIYDVSTLSAAFTFVGPDQYNSTLGSGVAADALIKISGSTGGPTSSLFSNISGGAGGLINMVAGTGGAVTNNTNSGTGGIGGNTLIGSGIGGSITGTAVNGTGGAGGTAKFFSSKGGTAQGTGIVTGGAGGLVEVYAGDGGTAQGSTGTRTGGAGGGVKIHAGTGGTGTANGGIGGDLELNSGSGSGTAAAGSIYIYPGWTSSSYSNIYLCYSKAGYTGGKVAIGTNTFTGSEKLKVAGDAVITGVVTGTHNLGSTSTPSSSADVTGSTGEIRYDESYLYIKTVSGWKRSALTTF